jgi:GH24 family phage-related lysozyme (muramidase)
MPIFKMPKMPGKATGLAAIVSASIGIGAPVTLHHEGMKLAPYYDSVGKLTWCGGETEVGYKPKFTFEECNELFVMRYGWYSIKTSLFYNDAAKAVVTPEVHATMTDMSYNIGLGGVKKSSMIRFMNAGQPAQACDAILRYKYAGKQDCSKPGNRSCPGVWTRRVEMHKLCKKGVR